MNQGLMYYKKKSKDNVVLRLIEELAIMCDSCITPDSSNFEFPPKKEAPA